MSFQSGVLLWDSVGTEGCIAVLPKPGGPVGPKEPIILISVDHKWRDLAGYVYAKLLLQQLGYRVILIRHNFEEYYADVYNPCALVMIDLCDTRKNALVRRLKRRGILVFLMPTEGIPTIESARKLAAGNFSDLSHVDVHFLWNCEMLDMMVQSNVMDSRKLCVVGVPRFDFYRPPLNALAPTKAQLTKHYRIAPERPIITWATNFTVAQFHERNREFLKRDWRYLQVDKVLEPVGIARKDHTSREMHFSSIIQLAEELDDTSVLLKLHPSEDHIYYYAKLRTLKAPLRARMRIINHQYIWDVLKATDVLLVRSCTTAVEAWLLGKPTIELRLNPDEWCFSKEHASGSNEATSYEELKRLVEYYLKGSAVPEALAHHRKDFIERWCHRVDGLSTYRFVSKMDQVIRAHSPRVRGKAQRSPFRLLRSAAIVLLMELTNFRLHNLRVYGLTGRVDKLGRSDKYFDRKDERFWIDTLSQVVT